MSSDDGNLITACAVGFGAGIFWFFKGFRVYREYRVLVDTPESSIRSIPMGLVEVHGKARGEQLVNSPVSKAPCLFYKVDIERWVQDRDGGHWSHYKTDADGVKFYLEDGTGKVLVDAHGAEYDLLQTVKRDTRGSVGRGLRMLLGRTSDPSSMLGSMVSNQELVAYVESLGTKAGPSISESLASSLGGLAFSRSLSLGRSSTGGYRLTEYCILPDHWYDVTGTCAENPNPKDEHDRNMIAKGQNEPTFLISWRSEQAVKSTLRNRAAKYIFGGAVLSIVCLAILLAKFGWL